ncbi:MAG: regulatory protein RecX [Candidatus Promineifilaceae bacterium]
MSDENFELAKGYALRYLARRPRSELELNRYLRGKGFEAPIIGQVLAYLAEVEMVDDAAFARYWVEQRESFRPRSQAALRHELYQKGIRRPEIEAAIAGLDETAAARQAAEPYARRWAELPREEFERKLGAFLQRRGFGYAIIHEVVGRLWQQLADEGDV